jgi:hypothetical protein
MPSWLPLLLKDVSYGGDVAHILFNYGVLTLAPCLLARSATVPTPAWTWCHTVLVALTVQVLVWFVLGAVGISLVSATLAGALLGATRTQDRAVGTTAMPVRGRRLAYASRPISTAR